MKKLGFTLSEVLIALGIVGVIASITSPLISSIIPDKKKVQVLKVAKTVSEINNELLNSPVFYYRESGSNCEGLDCKAPPLDSTLAALPGCVGETKYRALLEYHLDTVSTDRNGTFTTSDGVIWHFNSDRVFYVDLDPKGNNCSAAANCKKPDRYIFQVDRFGKVQGQDALTRVYLANPDKLNDRRADYRAAGL